jgi:hypothetical protein
MRERHMSSLRRSMQSAGIVEGLRIKPEAELECITGSIRTAPQLQRQF